MWLLVVTGTMLVTMPLDRRRTGKRRRKRRKRKRRRGRRLQGLVLIARVTMSLTPGLTKRGPRPKYHTPDAAKAQGVMAGTARPSFDTDSSGHEMSDSDEVKVAANTVELSETEMSSSDFDTDFSADDQGTVEPKTAAKPKVQSPSKSPKPTLKLKIKLPPQPDRLKPLTGSSSMTPSSKF